MSLWPVIIRSLCVTLPLNKIMRACCFPVLFLAVHSFQLLLPASALCDGGSESLPATPVVQTPGTACQASGSMQAFFHDVTRFFGIRYRFGGQTPEGFDCSGFVRFMYDRVFNIPLPRSSQEMAAIGRKISRDELKPGDLVFFQTKGTRINHVGIFIGSDTFVHSSLSKGITEDNLKQNYYDKRFVAAVRVIELPENNLPFQPMDQQPGSGPANPS